jgi:hypothetical protein
MDQAVAVEDGKISIEPPGKNVATTPHVQLGFRFSS